MRDLDKDRGANVRRNLRRWRKPLIAMNATWLAVTLATGAGAIVYAHEHHFSGRQVKMLGQSCGVILIGSLIAAWLTALLIADRKRDG